RLAKTQVLVHCIGTTVMAHVSLPGTTHSEQRSFDLADHPPKARARLVALTTVELISATWTETDFDDSGERHGLAPDLLAVPGRSAPPAPTHLRVLAVGGGMAFTSGTGLLAGGAARVGVERGMLGALFELGAHHGSRVVSLGTVTTDVLGATAAV